MAHIRIWNPYKILSWTHPEGLMLDYEINRAFSRQLKLNSHCCTMESLEHFQVNSSWMNGSFGIMESSQHIHVNSSWKTHVALSIQHIILRWTIELSQHSHMSSTWIARVGLWMTSALSYELLLKEWLMLDYGFITAFWCKHILNGPCCTIEFS